MRQETKFRGIAGLKAFEKIAGVSPSKFPRGFRTEAYNKRFIKKRNTKPLMNSSKHSKRVVLQILHAQHSAKRSD